MFRSRACLVAPIVLCLVSFAHATVIIGPQAVDPNPTSGGGNGIGDRPGNGEPAEWLIVQDGLFPKYTDGVTKFQSFIDSDPEHRAMGRWASEFGKVTGDMDFDLGSVRTILSFALWNVGGNRNDNIVSFDLIGDVDGDFSSGTMTLLSSATADINTGPDNAVLPDVFSFPAASVRYVRLSINSNNGNSNDTRAGEVAFEAIPEPTTAALLSLASLTLIRRPRRRGLIKARG